MSESALMPGFKKYKMTQVTGNRMRVNVDYLPTSLKSSEHTVLRIPKLDVGSCLVPNSLHLCFDLEVTGTKSWFKNNLARLLIRDLRVQMSNVTLYDCTNEFVFRVYQDLWKTQTERNDMTEYGVGSENLRKLLSGDDSGATTGSADNISDALIHTVFGKKLRIRINPIIEHQGLHAPRTMHNDFQFVLRLPSASELLIAQSGEAIGDYTLNAVTLEYETIRNMEIFNQATELYRTGFNLHYKELAYENYYLFPEDSTSMNIHVNTPRRSMQAVVLLFTPGSPTDSEHYAYPEIDSVRVTIEGVSNSLYDNTIPRARFFEEAKRFFGHHVESTMSVRDFYKDKFALVIDLRTSPDRTRRGNGRYIMNTQRGVQLAIAKRAHTGKGELTCHVFIFSDAFATIVNNNLSEVQR